jgi:hypothetical protein
MAGMAPGIMTGTATIGIPGASVGGQSIPTMGNGFMEDHRVLPMWRPLLPSWRFLLRNPNPISPSLQSQGSTGNSAMDFDEGGEIIGGGWLAKLPTNPNGKIS